MMMMIVLNDDDDTFNDDDCLHPRHCVGRHRQQFEYINLLLY